METSSRNFKVVSGVTIIICAIFMIALNIIAKENMDSYIMPFILLWLGVLFLTRKSDEERPQISMSPKKRMFMIASLSISLVGGIVALVFTLI